MEEGGGMKTEEIKSYYKKLFSADRRMFVRMNPKCPKCKKRAYGTRVCLCCGAYKSNPQ